MVYAAVVYDCNETLKSFLVCLYNVLVVKVIPYCLVNPFMMKLAGIQVDERLKFLAMVPSVAHHPLYFSTREKRMTLALDDIVSYSPFKKSTGEDIINPHDILHLTT